MPRERFKTLTEQMFYILLCLHEECRGMDILEMVRTLTNGRVNIGSGTLYDLLEQFLKEGAIEETKASILKSCRGPPPQLHPYREGAADAG
jgi:DNA-binding PadR family transcriptional regulator